MIVKLAWKNIWRNRVRSLVVIGSIIVGVWALLFLLSFVRGQVNNYVSNVIESQTSHIQIHQSQFSEDLEMKYLINQTEEIEKMLEDNPDVKTYSSRVLVNGMLSSAKGVQGVVAKGIVPEKEIATVGLNDKLVEGQFFNAPGRNPIVISRRMADKLNVKMKSKIVLTFQDVEGDLTSAAFRVVGIYDTRSKPNDELYVYVLAEDIRKLTEIADHQAHEIAIVLNDINLANTKAQEWSNQLARDDVVVETYKELSPDLELFNSQIKINMIVMTVIFMLALVFGIINTMLMAVLERMRELGMLMAIGMNKMKVFGLVVWETIFVGLLGAPLGMVFAYFTVRHYHEVGINLSRFSKGLESYGMSEIVRPFLDSSAYYFVAIAVAVTAVLSSVYPALKAIKLKPVEAIRKI